ncbi:MAG: UDP-glucose 4-epimerase GalE [Mycobacteriales bacterium]
MRLLVTGGAGYIGATMTALLLREGHQVIVLDSVTVLDDLSTGRREGVPAGAEFVEGDLTDADLVDKVVSGVDGILHFGAKALVGESMEQPAEYFRVNVGGAVNLVDAMRRHGVRKLIVSSTAATYGEPEELPITEDSPTRPTNAYGASKLAVDKLLRFAAPAYRLGAVSLRYFNVAGSYGGVVERHEPETHVIPNLLKAAASGQTFRLNGTDYPTPDGTCIRDYVHVEDLCRAHMLALDAAEPGVHKVYNIGSGSGFSVRQVIDAVRTVTGRDFPVEEAPRRAGDPARLVASSARIEAELGWVRTKPTLEDMVRDAWQALHA